jgi:hypothetical protein
MSEDLLSGLNSLVNAADKPAQKQQKPLPQTTPAGKLDPQPAADPESLPSFEGGRAQQILDRLDGIRAAIDGLAAGGPKSVPGAALPGATPSPGATPPAATGTTRSPDAPLGRPRIPAPTVPARQPALSAATGTTLPGATPLQGGAALFLAGAALMLLAFALGMGYGDIVASSKFPYWYTPGRAAPGMPGALADWIAAPAGALLLPVITALLVLGGRELHREGRATAAKTVWAVAGVAAVASLVLPFMA